MTSRSRPTTRTFNDAGFTLVEILVVIGLIGLVMGIAVPNIGMALKMNLQGSTRELATIIRTAHDEAVLKGQVYRIAFDIDKSQYWVESGDRDFLMRSTEQEAAEKKKNERRSDEEKEKHKDSFSLATSVTKKKKSLSQGVKFTDLVTSRSKDPIAGGIVYAYVFPHGFIEKLVVHLKDSFDRETTLVVSSVSGKSKLFERYVKEVN
jgi:prepilin-type N-terminal cleavage/methylation domain-containing protein